ncbi:MAG: DUF4388 domain-containing protein [Candidatus Schekmanbacteria bacterium]|nr:DUF4388 domain-containing protein [Candidatus Schekmanbacteria bacterium]
MLQGNLADIELSQVLHHLHFCRKSGCIRFASAGDEKLLYFLRGDLIYASSNQPSERVGAFLVERGMLGPEQLEVGLLESERSHTNLTDYLVSARLITAHDLTLVLKELTEKIIFGLSRWRSGEFRFEEPLPNKVTQSLRLASAGTLMEGIRRFGEWEETQRYLGSQDTVLQVVTGAEKHPRHAFLTPAEQEVLSLVDGHRTARMIATESHVLAFDACSALARLIRWELVRRVEAPPEPSTHATTFLDRPPAGASAEKPSGQTSFKAIRDRCRKLVAEGSFEKALELLHELRGRLESDRARADLESLEHELKVSEAAYMRALVRTVGTERKIPRRRHEFGIGTSPTMTIEAGFVLSQIDGQTSNGDLCTISGLSRLRTYEVLEELAKIGAIDLAPRRSHQPAASPDRKPVEAPAPAHPALALPAVAPLAGAQGDGGGASPVARPPAAKAADEGRAARDRGGGDGDGAAPRRIVSYEQAEVSSRAPASPVLVQADVPAARPPVVPTAAAEHADRVAKAAAIYKDVQRTVELDHLEDALTMMEKATSLDPGNASYLQYYRSLKQHVATKAGRKLFALAEKAHQTGNLQDAWDLVNRAIAADPTVAKFYAAAAAILAESGASIDQAKRCARKSIEMEPLNADFHYILGVIHMKAGDNARAQEDLRCALTYNPAHADARKALARLKRP